jgi:hypothetical protein
MQHMPVVQLPKEKRHYDWGLIIATILLVVIALLAVVAVARPDLFTGEPAVSRYANPEVMQAERYMAMHSAAEQQPGPTNPELSASYRFQAQRAEDQFLRENPEIRRFLNSQENQ